MAKVKGNSIEINGESVAPGTRKIIDLPIPNFYSAQSSLNMSVHVVDSSADFRYSNQLDYEVVYGSEHGAPELLDQFFCALPEHAPTFSKPHVGHPGCFATATLLATVPLAASGLTDGNLNRHLKVLVDGGLVTLRKVKEGGRAVTNARMTARGRSTFVHYLDELERVIRDARARAAADGESGAEPAGARG